MPPRSAALKDRLGSWLDSFSSHDQENDPPSSQDMDQHHDHAQEQQRQHRSELRSRSHGNDKNRRNQWSSSPDLEDGSSNHSSSTSSDFDGGGEPASARITTSHQQHETSSSRLLPITWTLPLLNFVDMLAVSLVVPLLFQYYKAAGVASANQREFLSSLFNAAQIVGGITLSILRDALGVQSRTLLFASFGGSALSYAMIAYSTTTSSSSLWGLYILMASRVLVGFVKQTMTVCTTLLTTVTAKQDRAQYMGRLTASSTVAWIVGPSVGALLYKYLHPKAPALLASALFGLNIVLVTLLLPSSPIANKPNSNSRTILNNNNNNQTALSRITSNLRLTFGSRELAVVVVARLVMAFVQQATSFAQLGSFYEELYGVPSHYRGYLSSFQQLLQFGVQAWLVPPILALAQGDTRTLAYVLCFGLAVADLLQAVVPVVWFYLLVVCPLASLCLAMMRLSLETLTTQVAPQKAMFSVLAALDILQSMVGVTVPFYRTLLFRFLVKSNEEEEDDNQHHLMEGDPDPRAWVLSSSVHWLLAATLITLLLAAPSPSTAKDKGR